MSDRTANDLCCSQKLFRANVWRFCAMLEAEFFVINHAIASRLKVVLIAYTEIEDANLKQTL